MRKTPLTCTWRAENGSSCEGKSMSAMIIPYQLSLSDLLIPLNKHLHHLRQNEERLSHLYVFAYHSRFCLCGRGQEMEIWPSYRGKVHCMFQSWGQPLTVLSIFIQGDGFMWHMCMCVFFNDGPCPQLDTSQCLLRCLHCAPVSSYHKALMCWCWWVLVGGVPSIGMFLRFTLHCTHTKDLAP